MLNEMLLLDIHTHEAGTGQAGERPPSDLISRVRGYLEMRLPGKTGSQRQISETQYLDNCGGKFKSTFI